MDPGFSFGSNYNVSRTFHERFTDVSRTFHGLEHLFEFGSDLGRGSLPRPKKRSD